MTENEGPTQLKTLRTACAPEDIGHSAAQVGSSALSTPADSRLRKPSDAPNSSNLEEILSQISEARVAVFGDFTLDAYWLIGDCRDEISVETSLPIRRVRQQRYSLGGAGNIIANLTDLGVRRIQAVGVVGRDPFGVELLRLLTERGVDVSGIIKYDDWETAVYAKPYFEEVEENRFDFGAFNEHSGETIDALMTALERVASNNDVVILNQQILVGVSTAEVIERVNLIIGAHADTRFVVDSRDRADLYRNAILKVNLREACHCLGESFEDGFESEEQIRSYASRIVQKTGQPVVLTLGEHGMLIADSQGIHGVPGIQILEPTDPVGAGDTVTATLSAVLATGRDVLTAARLANVAASITVRKLQTTGTATPDEIRAVGLEPDYVYLPQLAREPRRAIYMESTEIELVSDFPRDLCIKHAIFDHDGTLSTLREGWEMTMEPMMVQAVLGPRYADADDSLHHKVVYAVRGLIDKTTGIQTLVQMRALVKLVRQFGFVPHEQILDEHGYKQIYNEQLLSVVRQRLSKLERGELGPEDFQIKNAVQFLHHLQCRGVKLYLASGTDINDVLAEAESLGYAHLFEGRIYGAVGDVRIEAKKMLVDRIIRENGLSGHAFATFGDGPVEIRETHKRGGVCVGVASDELRRFGLNPAKRARLIRAGAHIVIPDFSQLSALVGLLQLA